jgi:hypothetical protein
MKAHTLASVIVFAMAVVLFVLGFTEGAAVLGVTSVAIELLYSIFSGDDQRRAE